MSESPLRQQLGYPGTVRYDAMPCPACGKVNDAFSDASGGDRQAYDGAFAVCVGCGVMSIISISALGVALREPTPAELDEFTTRYAHIAANPRAYVPRRWPL